MTKISLEEMSALLNRQERERDQLTVKHAIELRAIAEREGRHQATRLWTMKINETRRRWADRGQPLDQ